MYNELPQINNKKTIPIEKKKVSKGNKPFIEADPEAYQACEEMFQRNANQSHNKISLCAHQISKNCKGE